MSTEEPADVARLREAFASVRGDGQAPVDAARIFDALHGEMSAAEREAVVEELLANPDAAEAWRLARELAPEAEAVARPPAATGRANWQWLAAAAVLVLAVGAGWQWLRPAPEPVYRGSEGRAIAAAVPDGAALVRTAAVLRWTGVDGARYRVRVLTPELLLLAESDETTALEYTIPADALSGVAPGGQVLWQVEGRLADGTVIVSPTFSARVE